MEQDTSRRDVIMAGVGGRGVLMAGMLLAQAAVNGYQNVLWFPSYATAMRGGPCECTVILSDNEIDSPIVPQAQAVIVVEPSQYKPFEGRVLPGGLVLVESAGAQQEAERGDVRILSIPALDAAMALGSSQVANLVLLGAYLELTKVVSLELIEEVLEKRLAGREKVLALNKSALRKGAELVNSGIK